jgi:NTP pyrophosphatase (non-canonical NTP hydrolase)
MRKKTSPDSSQILLFPSGDPVPSIEIDSLSYDCAPSGEPLPVRRRIIPECEVVVSGSFRRDIEGLRRLHEELMDYGCVILSPKRVSPSREVDGFVFMDGEEGETPERIEQHHLEAIQNSTFVWLHAPDGYVGLSAALEVGFAHAQGIPVFCKTRVSEIVLATFVHEVPSVGHVVELVREKKLPPPEPNLRSFQHYYKRVASQRGYERETAQNCLLLMVEEVGELAHAVRKREKLVRHGAARGDSEAHELADVFLYVIHMANILGLDLGSVVREKEEVNLAKLVQSR